MAYTTINKPNLYFNTVLYTGDGTTSRSITGVGFQPDWVWAKGRSTSYYHGLWDAVRTNKSALYSNSTDAEDTTTGGTLGSFNSDGFTTPNVSGGFINNSGTTYVAWNWLANGAGVSNTSGSITSTVSANTTSGFSIVSWTGTGSNSDQTLGTGLSTALNFIIAKARDTGGGTDQWVVYVNGVTDAQNNCLLLNSTNALTTSATGGTANRGSTAGQLKLLAGTTNNQNLNASGLKYIAYCFHNVKGYSKFGSWTGNGNADGTFVYLGFKPEFVMLKNASGTNQWLIFDNTREPANVMGDYLEANSSAAEATFNGFDFLSNGMKMRTSNDAWNASGNTYIYMAFAENPFVSSTFIPTTAR
jgi:hypothetical protein